MTLSIIIYFFFGEGGGNFYSPLGGDILYTFLPIFETEISRVCIHKTSYKLLLDGVPY
jgi:hypothetical protein